MMYFGTLRRCGRTSENSVPAKSEDPISTCLHELAPAPLPRYRLSRIRSSCFWSFGIAKPLRDLARSRYFSLTRARLRSSWG